MEALASFRYLEVLDLSWNSFVGSIPSITNLLSSLKVVSFANNFLNGSLPDHVLCELKNLEELDLSGNMFDGEVPQCFNTLSSLKLFDISSNQFSGILPPSLIANLTSLEYVDFSHNKIEGLFSLSSFSNHTNLEFFRFESKNYKLEVETEESIDWIPMFQLKILVLSNCNIKVLMEVLFLLFYFTNTSYKNANTRQLDMSGNNLIGTIPEDIQKFIPHITDLNFSSNALNGVIPFSVGDLRNIGNNTIKDQFGLTVLDISDNFFTGVIPSWISNMHGIVEVLVRNNSFEGQFPCGKASILFLDISQNSFSGPIPSCLNLQNMQHLHLGSNRFIGAIPNTFRNLTKVLTLDIGKNYLSGKIPKFLGDLSNLRILLLGKNNFIGSIPKQLCKLTDVSLIDLSSNSLSGLIPRCLQNITGPKKVSFIQYPISESSPGSYYIYGRVVYYPYDSYSLLRVNTQDEAQFTTKSISHTYKGNILDYMSGLDLSFNKLTGQIPHELGMLTQILALNLSHNRLTGHIPVTISNLKNIESLDLSSNGLTGEVPFELIQLNYLAVFNVSYNNLSGKLPELKSQFATFTKESYEGNPLLCGPPLENKCLVKSHMTHPSNKEGTDEKLYDIDIASFYGSCGSTWFMFMFGFATLFYINPY
ncbi:hypothetical protein L1987_30786 [Smallanthus sonchifolius]|uniref:Uncharacterized protein n=1 Tax=Smallanthus sonchifolius TaxID=185202 RepID=A0ACB9I597_9ASTR|nr:hypothetical protein L1987_30786 [Smallanthus sonchifolius]